MPTIRKAVSLAIGETQANIFQGSIYETMQRPTRVQVAAAASTGDEDIGIGVQFGSRTMALSSETLVPIEPYAGGGPNVPDQTVVDDVALPGEKLVVSLAGGAGAATVRVMALLTEG